jgi:hypothetical protein
MIKKSTQTDQTAQRCQTAAFARWMLWRATLAQTPTSKVPVHVAAWFAGSGVPLSGSQQLHLDDRASPRGHTPNAGANAAGSRVAHVALSFFRL